ncbi:methyltransferase family protein [Roseicyclus persicicus]|uniref:Isoprenylcysteine carboxylmethyltransferase family protein n=1 Tax=Roseicyclus persicicus TaxID=2650661 RepID=A0A7X6JWR1_9RHOB|nr:isoprenylcysteine carboxylmethyltransferase family protein [Roseibacterium persicicum]NKX44727.1 isoprenylcysteine carboxylmethyltransferase family protein [Roseibacterium persicicum]
MKHFPDLPPVWLLLGLVLAWVLATWLPLVRLFGPAWQAAGVLLALAGTGLILWAAWWFWRKRTTIEPHHEPGRLIVEGPYRFSRNPIYLGMLAILTGAVLWHGALSGLPLPFAFAAILTRRFIAPEEAALRRAFGAEAHDYLDRTRRWL